MSLLEVIISIGICCTLIIGVLSLIPTARIALKKTQVRLCADAEADSQLEKWRGASWAAIQSQDLEPLALEGLPVFQRHLEVLPGASDKSKELQITLTWDWAGQPYRLERRMVICNLPR